MATRDGWRVALLVLWAALAWGFGCAHASEAGAGAPPLDTLAIDRALAPILMDGENFSLSPAPLAQGRWGYLVYIGPSMEGLLLARPAGAGYEYKLVREVDEARLVLVEYYRETEADGAAVGQMDQAHFAMLRFNRSRGGAEGECRRLLGMGNGTCSDYEGCLKSCYSSTSFCLPIALDSGQGFIYQMLDYNNRTRALEEAMIDEDASWKASRNGITLATVANYRRTLQSVSSARERMGTHPFIGVICQKALYNDSALEEAYRHLGRANELLLPLSGKNNTAVEIMAATQARVERKAAAGQAAANASASGAGEWTPGPGAAEAGGGWSLPSLPGMPALDAGLIALVGAGALMLLAGAGAAAYAGYRWMKRRR